MILGRIIGLSISSPPYPHTLTCDTAFHTLKPLYSCTPWLLSSVMWFALANGMWAEVTILFYILSLWCHHDKNIAKWGHQSKKREDHTKETWDQLTDCNQTSLTPNKISSNTVDSQICEGKKQLPFHISEFWSGLLSSTNQYILPHSFLVLIF